jgi:transposase-like protein
MGIRKVCPECDRTDIYKRKPSHEDSHGSDKNWYCGRCGADFDEANTRDVQHRAGYSGLARKLIEADPDELETHR